MNKTALFCDGTEGYVYPPEPKESELVTFRFRTAKDDVDRVGLVTSADTYVMEKECTQGEFDYYTFETRLGEEPFRYCFEVQSGTEKYYYGRCGISREILEYYNFVVVPGFSTPRTNSGHHGIVYAGDQRFCVRKSYNTARSHASRRTQRQ